MQVEDVRAAGIREYEKLMIAAHHIVFSPHISMYGAWNPTQNITWKQRAEELDKFSKEMLGKRNLLQIHVDNAKDSLQEAAFSMSTNLFPDAMKVSIAKMKVKEALKELDSEDEQAEESGDEI